MINKKQLFLIGSAPVLCLSMLFLMPYLTIKFGRTAGFIAGFCIYWFVFCLPVCVYSSGGTGRLKEIYHQCFTSTTKKKGYGLLALIPCVATFFAVFKATAPIAGYQVLVIALVFALINGTIEEMFWRGIFNQIFKENLFWAYIYPTVFFGIWHIAVYFANGIVYQGGFFSLVGGSFFMGFLWGLAAYKTKSIKVVTAAHIVTNFFAFTGLIYQNWFM